MLDILLPIVDLALFGATLFWVGRKPTVPKVSAMILIVAIVHLGFDAYYALSQGMSLYGWFLQTFDETVQQSSQMMAAGQAETMQAMAPTIAGCVYALYVVSASMMVFVALLLMWVLRRILHRDGQWTAFSQVDLTIWAVCPLIAGLVVLAFSFIRMMPGAEVVYIVGLNILIVSVIPLFVQGAASAKGVMNKVGFGPVLQAAFFVAALLVGVLFFTLPIWGLIDFWANFRKLPRSSESE